MIRRNFKPAKDVVWAAFTTNEPSFINNTKALRLTKVQRDGLRYEKRAQDYLLRLCERSGELSCIHNPWVIFRNKSDLPSTVNFCQPDSILVTRDQSKVTVVEIKLNHTKNSWEQLRLLYEPVLRKIYPPSTKFSLLEICKWFDPHTNFPETFYCEENPLECAEGRIAIHIYKPRGRAPRRSAGKAR